MIEIKRSIEEVPDYERKIRLCTKHASLTLRFRDGCVGGQLFFTDFDLAEHEITELTAATRAELESS